MEAHGVETGDPNCPFLARVTLGTRNHQDIMHEWPAPSVGEGEQQAADWIEEFAYRCSFGRPDEATPEAVRQRAKRLARYKGIPDFPPPIWDPVYDTLPEGEIPGSVPLAPPTKERRSYATKAKVKHAVQAAEAAGIDVTGIRIWPDGSVAAFDARSSALLSDAAAAEPVNTEDWFD